MASFQLFSLSFQILNLNSASREEEAGRDEEVVEDPLAIEEDNSMNQRESVGTLGNQCREYAKMRESDDFYS